MVRVIVRMTGCDRDVCCLLSEMRGHFRSQVTLALLLAASCFCPTMQAAVSSCATCHPKENARFLASAMGQSLTSSATQSAGEVTHERSHSVITIAYRNGRMIHTLTEGGVTAEYPIRYQVGGKLMGSSFLIQIGDYLFESPASWFRSYGWDVSPGYASAPLIDFDRPMSDACLFCHADAARFADADGRRLQGPPLGSISCERCHGPSQEHARHPTAKNIINPARLAGAERDSICEQCHLEAAGRILNPGKRWDDFHAGEPVEQTFATYVLKSSDNNNSKQVVAVSQVEELAESECARKSGGKLWCGTCHDPHGAAKDRQQEMRAICTSCHIKLSPAAHPANQRECTSCHMPSTPTTNVTHAALTDHRILRRRLQEPPGSAQDAGEQTGKEQSVSPRVVAWREPPREFRNRDLALAEILAAVSQNQPSLKEEGSRLLEGLPLEQRDGDFEVLSAAEGLSLQHGDLPTALQLGRRSVALRPQSAKAAMNLGIVLQRSGDATEAERQFRRAIELDISLKPAYLYLAILYGSQGRTQEMMDMIDRFLKWNPQDIMFRLQKAQHSSSH
jgi:predicted CXXCH cytochrome family protein